MATRFNKTLDDVLYPPLEPSKTGMLPVSDLHTVYWEQSGNMGGQPVIVLHGGPGQYHSVMCHDISADINVMTRWR